MTREEIDLLFPPEHGGNAQISDLRLLLTRLVSTDAIGGITFTEVATIAERDALEAEDADICKVQNDNTYIWDGIWKVLVENTGGGGSPSGNVTTEKRLISTLNEQHQYMELIHIPNTQEHIFVFLNGMYLMLGTSYDYTISNNRIIFSGCRITAGDHLAVKYNY